jgi:hypothetical protein
MFVGIAFQPFIYMMVALQIGLWTYVRRREREAGWRPLIAQARLAGMTPASNFGQRPTGQGF